MTANVRIDLSPLGRIPDSRIPHENRRILAELDDGRRVHAGRAVGAATLCVTTAFFAALWLASSAYVWAIGRDDLGLILLAPYAGCALAAWLTGRAAVRHLGGALERHADEPLRRSARMEEEIEHDAARLNREVLTWNEKLKRGARSRPDPLEAVVLATQRKVIVRGLEGFDRRLDRYLTQTVL